MLEYNKKSEKYSKLQSYQKAAPSLLELFNEQNRNNEGIGKEKDEQNVILAIRWCIFPDSLLSKISSSSDRVKIEHVAKAIRGVSWLKSMF